jgi:Flp pilus assembly protein TadB
VLWLCLNDSIGVVGDGEAREGNVGYLAALGYVLILIGIVALVALHLGPLPYVAFAIGGILLLRWILNEVANRR